MTDDLSQLPPPPPARSTRVRITLGPNRYELTISARADQVQPEPAEVIEMPKRD